MNAANATAHSRAQRSSRGANTRATNTPTEFMQCPRCSQSTTSQSETASSSFLTDYISSLNYINKCHMILNHVLRYHNPNTEMTIPDLPNFLNIFNCMDRNAAEFIDVGNITSIDELVVDEEAPTTQRGALVSRGVDAHPPQVASVKTNTKRSPDTRWTGIPRRVTTRNPSAKNLRKPIVLMASNGGRYEKMAVGNSTSTLIGESESAPPVSDDGQLTDPEPPPRKMPDDPKLITNEDLDYFARQLLRVTSQEVASSSKTSSKDEIDTMVHSFFRQLNFQEENEPEVQPQTSLETVEPNEDPSCSGSISCEPAPTVHKQKRLAVTPFCLTNRAMRPLRHASDTTLSDMDLAPGQSAAFVASNEMSKQEMNFHNFARCIDDQSAFLMNEKPAWAASTASLTLQSEQSDIEPDDESEIASYRQMPQRRVARAVSARQADRSVILNTDRRRASYLVMRKPQDAFLMLRRRHSHSDVDSERDTYNESDIDDSVFTGRQKRGAVKQLRARETRQPQIPANIVSNIGILTKTGAVRPERENQIQAMRSRLSSDMQTHLFRNPRNRKTDANDIVLISTEDDQDEE